MSYLLRDIKVTIGDIETTPGSGGVMESVIPIRANPGLDCKGERVADPAIVGSVMDIGDYSASTDVSGSLQLTPRAIPGYGKFIKGVLGTESTPVQVVGCIRVLYTGTGASCKLEASNSGKTLASSTGTYGAEVADDSFGTAGEIDFTQTGADTLVEVVALIDGYANYECEKVFGIDAASTDSVISKICQGKDKWAYIYFGGTSTAYMRQFTLDLSSTERPTYPIQKDMGWDSYLYTGIAISSFTLGGKLKAMAESDADCIGFTETDSQTPSVLTLEAGIGPMFFWNGSTSIKGENFNILSEVNFKIDNQMSKDTYGQGSVGRTYHMKGLPVITGDLTLPLNNTNKVYRDDLFGSTSVTNSISFYFKGNDVQTGIPGMVIVEVPFAQWTNWEPSESGGVFNVKCSYKGINPPGTHYDVPLTITFVSDDSAAF